MAKVVEGELSSNKSRLQELKRSSAGSGQVLEVEEHLEMLGEIGKETWLDVDCQL